MPLEKLKYSISNWKFLFVIRVMCGTCRIIILQDKRPQASIHSIWERLMPLLEFLHSYLMKKGFCWAFAVLHRKPFFPNDQCRLYLTFITKEFSRKEQDFQCDLPYWSEKVLKTRGVNWWLASSESKDAEVKIPDYLFPFPNSNAILQWTREKLFKITKLIA